MGAGFPLGGWGSHSNSATLQRKKSNSRPLPLPLTTPAENCAAKPNRGQGGGILEMETFLKASSSWSSRRSADALWRQECVCLGPCMGGWGGSTQLMHSCSPALCKAGPVLTWLFSLTPHTPALTPGASAIRGGGVQGPLSHPRPALSPPSVLSVFSFLPAHFSVFLCVCLFSSIQ